jgi:hypothetical protein
MSCHRTDPSFAQRTRAQRTIQHTLLVIAAVVSAACHKDAPPDQLMAAQAANACVEITEFRRGYTYSYVIREVFVPVTTPGDSAAVLRHRESVARSQGHEFGLVRRRRPPQDVDSVRMLIQLTRPIVMVADAWHDSPQTAGPDNFVTPTAPRARLVRRCRQPDVQSGR